MKNIIALDTSIRNTGYVRGLPDGSGAMVIDSFGVDPKLSGKVGQQMIDFRAKLLPRLHEVDMIFIEEPVRPGATGNLKTLRPLYALSAMVMMIAHQKNIPVVEVDNRQHKKLIYGTGGAKPKNVVDLASRWGFNPKNDDEADACGVFLFGVQEHFPEAFPAWLNTMKDASYIPIIARPKKRKSPTSKRKKRAKLTG